MLEKEGNMKQILKQRCHNFGPENNAVCVEKKLNFVKKWNRNELEKLVSPGWAHTLRAPDRHGILTCHLMLPSFATKQPVVSSVSSNRTSLPHRMQRFENYESC